MRTVRSFTEYVADRFYNQIVAQVQEFVDQNTDSLDLQLRKVRSIGVCEVEDVEIKHVWTNRLRDIRIRFDVITDAEISVREDDYHYDETESAHQWFLVSCEGDLAQQLSDFEIIDTEIYVSGKRQRNDFDDSLAPIIHSDDLERVATEFLEKYYHEALTTPMWLDPIELSRRMNLTVRKARITRDYSIFGQMFFREFDTELYDPTSDSLVTETIPASTILVDPDIAFMRNLGAYNNTVVHECVHWDQHMTAFTLERLYNPDAARIRCEVTGGAVGNKRNSVDWMEWQANALAPRIQMPVKMFKLRISQLTTQYRLIYGLYEPIDYIEPLIEELSTFFGVSKTAAKIRMIEVGYDVAQGAFNYIDGCYVKPHEAKRGFLKRNQTFCIGSCDAACVSLMNPQFAADVQDGRYQYVNSHFVLNHPKYIATDDDGLTDLTRYARNHMDECCLVFELEISNVCGERYQSECYLCRDKESPVSFSIIYRGGHEYSPADKQKELLAEMIRSENAMYSALPNSYTAALSQVKKALGYTAVEIGQIAGINEATVRRIINGDESGSINSLVLICLAMHLPYKVSKHIIDSSPHQLNLANTSHQWYDFVLMYMYAESMKTIKAFLSDQGADPL